MEQCLGAHFLSTVVHSGTTDFDGQFHGSKKSGSTATILNDFTCSVLNLVTDFIVPVCQDICTFPDGLLRPLAVGMRSGLAVGPTQQTCAAQHNAASRLGHHLRTQEQALPCFHVFVFLALL